MKTSDKHGWDVTSNENELFHKPFRLGLEIRQWRLVKMGSRPVTCIENRSRSGRKSWKTQGVKFI